MPTLSSLNIPTPKSWDEFEDICLSSFKLRWASPNLTKHGRQGQPQNGVDIYGEDNLGQIVGVQCKNYDLELTMKTIEEEIEKTESFKPDLKAFYIATTAPSDTKVQSAVRIISGKRVVANKFPIGIFFWNDIIQDLANNESVFSKHFPQFNIKGSNTHNGQKLLAVLDLVYYGVNFSQSLGLLFGEVYEDPNQLSILCNVLESASMQLMTEKKQQNLVADLKEIVDYVLPWVEGNEKREQGWAPVTKRVKSVEQKVIGLQYELSNDELVVFQLGLALANWDRTTVNNRNIRQRDEDNIRKLTRKLFGKTPKGINNEIKIYKDDKTIGVVNCPFKCYVICKDYIIQRQLYE
ncbi:hypothetical protein QWZ08_07205 [Ferruginibacter paludis]|uniref:hypothetical protein n=1 Tax=Ferruginibacter paludis TaxID=1310417 RepID=UPI0025B44D7D|nr:hypothetical protein [Ferruginibacter paludis]MDN3655405.1 hypothetical protein [Ferruginibacter paludis]